MMTWTALANTPSSPHYRPAEGQRDTVAFVGEPHLYEVHYVDGRYEQCEGFEKCTYCDTEPPSERAAVNIYIPDHSRTYALNAPRGFLRHVKALAEKHPLDRWLFVLARVSGSNGRPYYDIAPDKEMSDEQRPEVADAPLHNLEEIVGRPPASATQRRHAIHHRLKALGEAAWKKLSEHFGIERVRHIGVEDLTAAEAMLDKMEGTATDPHSPKRNPRRPAAKADTWDIDDADAAPPRHRKRRKAKADSWGEGDSWA